MSDEELKSLREWLEHWGEGPNWSDPKGMTVPIAKVTLRQLLDDLELARKAFKVLVEATP